MISIEALKFFYTISLLSSPVLKKSWPMIVDHTGIQWQKLKESWSSWNHINFYAMWPFILTFWKLWVHFPSFLKIIIYCPMAFHWLLKKLFITLVKNRPGSFRDDIFCSSLWLDPQIKTLIQHFCKLQVLYMLNGNHSNNQSIIHTPGISSNIGENLCIPK